MSRDYNEAKEYIEDIKDICDDFEGLCQRNLAANTGIIMGVILLVILLKMVYLRVILTVSKSLSNTP